MHIIRKLHIVHVSNDVKVERKINFKVIIDRVKENNFNIEREIIECFFIYLVIMYLIHD